MINFLEIESVKVRIMAGTVPPGSLKPKEKHDNILSYRFNNHVDYDISYNYILLLQCQCKLCEE